MKKSYSIQKLNDLEFLTRILRTAKIPFDTALTLHKNNLSIASGITQYKDEVGLLQERLKADDSEEAKKEFQEDATKLNKKEFEVDITMVQGDVFKDVEGEGKYLGNGTMETYSYREAYFLLLGEVISE